MAYIISRSAIVRVVCTMVLAGVAVPGPPAPESTWLLKHNADAPDGEPITTGWAISPVPLPVGAGIALASYFGPGATQITRDDFMSSDWLYVVAASYTRALILIPQKENVPWRAVYIIYRQLPDKTGAPVTTLAVSDVIFNSQNPGLVHFDVVLHGGSNGLGYGTWDHFQDTDILDTKFIFWI
jgi:hypothetical protein